MGRCQFRHYYMTAKFTAVATATRAVLLAAATLFVRAADQPELKDLNSRASYAIGTQIGKSFKRQGAELDARIVAGAIDDILKDRKLALTDEELKKTLEEYQTVLQQAEGGGNLKKGEAFLAANAKKEGVKTTKTGLQYKVLKSGTGKTPKDSDTVKVHYHGTLIDGTVFDSSIDRNEPVTFPVTGVIPGWIEALQLMKEGDKWQLVIPAKLAYGDHPPAPPIGVNSTLLFDVELLSIEKPQ